LEEAGQLAGYTDGSRIEGVTGAALAESGIFLGELATVMDAEMLGMGGRIQNGSVGQ